jgi:hypothetical protein
MAFLPPSTNKGFKGSPASAWFTVALGFGWLLPGLVHSLLPDGGAGSIAGIDMSVQPQLVIALFAWAGATQIVHGLLLIMIGWRYRSLVPLALLLSLMERALLSLSGWVRHVPADGHHPPQHYGSLILLPVILLFLILSLRTSESR